MSRHDIAQPEAPRGSTWRELFRLEGDELVPADGKRSIIFVGQTKDGFAFVVHGPIHGHGGYDHPIERAYRRVVDLKLSEYGALNGMTVPRHLARTCTTCGRERVQVNDNGKFARHYTRSASGRREACLASGQNALTAEELGWGRLRP